MIEGHHPELRKLAQAILDGIDPAVRAAAASVTGGSPLRAGTGRCQQVWCPVCALAALVTGEQHPLLTVIADHSIALLDVIRAMVDDVNRSSGPAPQPPPDGAPDGGSGGGGSGNGGPAAETPGNGPAKTRYQHIPITFEE